MIHHEGSLDYAQVNLYNFLKIKRSISDNMIFNKDRNFDDSYHGVLIGYKYY